MKKINILPVAVLLLSSFFVLVTILMTPAEARLSENGGTGGTSEATPQGEVESTGFTPTGTTSGNVYSNASSLAMLGGTNGTNEVTPQGEVENTGFTPTETTSGNADCKGVGLAVDVNCDNSEDNAITAYLNGILNFLAGGVGLVVVIMVATGGIQYMMAGGNPQATQAAVKRVTDALIGLLFFIFLYGILMWVIPGGWL